MRIALATFAVALLIGPAAAQIGGMNLLDGYDRRKSQEEIEKEKAADEAYNSAMKKVPDQKKATNDPWADVRGMSESKAQKQTRSGPSSQSK